MKLKPRGERRNYSDDLVGDIKFGTGSLTVAPGIVVASAPSEARSFVWTKKEALVLAELLDVAAPTMASALRAAAKMSVDEFGGYHRE